MKMYFRMANFLLSESRIAADKWITRNQIELSFSEFQLAAHPPQAHLRARQGD
ncbi:MAG: hypothetical protein OXP71_11840 [Candidatus Poribacteria bacterium]|nr:hypothetical protein [Candidatus Poribacteria bacterium]